MFPYISFYCSWSRVLSASLFATINIIKKILFILHTHQSSHVFVILGTAVYHRIFFIGQLYYYKNNNNFRQVVSAQSAAARYVVPKNKYSGNKTYINIFNNVKK